MTQEKAETLAHRTDWGEVDPRTYPLVGTVRLACEKIGDNERVSQANRLIHAVDALCEAEGEPRVRIHLTVAPGGDARKAIEVRIQPLTQRTEAADKALAAKIVARWPEVLAKGKDRWTAV
jgi:hypothetical protein